MGRKAITTIEDIQSIAIARGGLCLSKQYVNSTTKLTFQCAKGHRWETTPASLKIGTWCHECGGRKKHTIGEMNQLATERGGKCLSVEYIDATSDLLWQCEKKHIWIGTFASIRNGGWCPACKGRGFTIDIKNNRLLLIILDMLVRRGESYIDWLKRTRCSVFALSPQHAEEKVRAIYNSGGLHNDNDLINNFVRLMIEHNDPRILETALFLNKNL